MDTSINLQDNFIDKLLSLSDDMKLRIINKLSESLLDKNTSRNKRGAVKRKNDGENTLEFINSLVIKGGVPVPENINDINSLLDEKYA